MVETQKEHFKILNDRLKLLQDESERIEKEKSAIELELYRLEYSVPDPTDDDLIISFVNAIENANQYFEFEYFLEGDERIKPDSDKLEIFKLLVKEERVQDQYRKLDFKDIMEAINGRILDQQTGQEWKVSWISKLGKSGKDGNKSDSTFFDEETMRLKSLTLMDAEVLCDLNPILNLAYQIREKAYVMKDNPLDELDIIKEYHPMFYNRYFVQRPLLNISAKMMMVRNVPLDYKESDIIKSFSECGEVERVDVESADEWGNIAFVTFRDPEGAKLAPFLKGETSYHVEWAPPFESEVIVKSSGNVNEAKRRYQEFRNFKKSTKRANKITRSPQTDKKVKGEPSSIGDGVFE